MKKLFEAIRKNDLETVMDMINKNPELISCTAKQPPKKDDGQSPLQASLKTGRLAIADFLLDHGADVNFIEDSSCCNEWRSPAIHDAVRAAVMCSRWNVCRGENNIEVFSTEKKANKAYEILEKMIKLGANVNSLDSYKNSLACIFCIQAMQILPNYNWSTGEVSKDRVITDELKNDLIRIYNLLKENSADFSYIMPNLNKSIVDYFKNTPIGQLLNF